MQTPTSLTPQEASSNGMFTIADALKSLQQNIQAEDTLIASRMTWYVTTQAFLITAYATSWNAHFAWTYFFHTCLPMVAISLSLLTLASIFAATWAQDVYLREQAILVAQLNETLRLDAQHQLALASYARTMVGNRVSKNGKLIGNKLHALVRITPLILPLGFAVMWVYALCISPA